MSESKDQWTAAVSRLIELTQTKELEWKAYMRTDLLESGPEDKVVSAYESTYKSRRLRIFKRTYKVIGWAFHTRIDLAGGGGMGKESYWTTTVVLQLGKGEGWWTFPSSTALSVSLHDLHEAVTYQAADVQGFLGDLLQDEPS